MTITLSTQKLTQKQRVLAKLEEDGEISNLWAFHNQIWRLAAVIADLKKEGYYFRGDYIEGTKNWCYWWLKTNNLKI